MELEINCRLISGMAFEAEVQGHRIMLDADSGEGGNDLGPRPKPLLMISLAGCTGMDVISILRKMRIEPRYLNVHVKAQILDDYPKKFKSMQLIYEVSDDVPPDNIDKAIQMSLEKYCGVYATLYPGVKISHEVLYKK